jgi:hypothetical protein
LWDEKAPRVVHLGDLDVEVLEITRGQIEIGAQKIDNKPLDRGNALILKLRFKNTSSDLSFYPMDRFFTRFWLPGGQRAADGLERWMPADKEPYTRLEVGRSRFYGGAAAFRPPGTDRDQRYLDEYVQGQDYDEILEPGKELTTFVCTDGDADDRSLLKAVNDCKEKMLWRVQVRRGSVTVEGKRIPCTAVIGVEFTPADIKDEKKG